MPIPQGVPIAIAPLAFPLTQGVIGSAGPYLSGTNLFYFSAETRSDFVIILSAFRSADGGNTFTRINAAGVTIDGSSQQVCVSYDRSGNNVYVGYLSGSDHVEFIVFTMGPGPTDGTWGSPNDSTITDGNVGRLWAVNIGTSVYVAWQHSNTSVYYAYFNGSSWSARVEVGGVLNKQIVGLSLASTGQAALWWGNAGFGPTEVFYSLLNGATVVSTVTALDLTSGDQKISNFGSSSYSVYYDSVSDSSVLPLPMTTISTGVQFQAVLIAATSASPSFSLVTVATLNILDVVGRPFLTGNYAGTSFFILWSQRRDSDGEMLLEYSTATALAGPWSAAALYYDLQANTPSPSPANDSFDLPNANFTSGGQVGAILGLTQHFGPPFEDWCGIIYTWPLDTATTTLELIKVVASGSADPSDFTLMATGDNSPETVVTGPGPTVGPEDVAAATYELSEVGPSGYSGTWDCAGAEMPTSTSVVVPEGESVVCTITNNVQTLTLHKVVQGGSAAPEDFTLFAVGGSPETEISGPGPTVGPEGVSAGTFELSETAPGGATWDAATSTWDGTTTWDSGGQYTPVWDCAGAPMPTPTSVVVSPGGGGPIPLGVTQVPDVDPTFQPLLSNGPFEFLIGGFFYQVLWNSGNRLGMFRRQASVGGMFTEVDQTNAPTGISGYGRATSRNTIISVCYMLPGNTTAQQVEFDVVAGTWGTPSLPVTLPAVTNLFCWVRRSDNTDVFVGAWASQWYYITNIAGVWGSVTNLFAHLGTVIGGVIDANDTTWFMVNYDFGANLSSVGLYPLSSTYVLGSAIANRQLIFQGPPFPYRFYPDVALYGTNAIAFAYSTAVNPTDNCQLRVDIIRPLSAPVLTSFLVIISPAGSQSYLLKLHDDGAGVLNLFYVHETTTPTNQVLQTIWTDPFNWSVPTVFYDPAVTPPFAGAAAQQISSLSPLPSNGWAVGAGMQTDQPAEITTAEIIQESSGGGSSDVACTVTNFFTGPPPNPPGPGQMNPVGCFELLRVDVTLMPARHLPVRGSVR